MIGEEPGALGGGAIDSGLLPTGVGIVVLGREVGSIPSGEISICSGWEPRLVVVSRWLLELGESGDSDEPTKGTVWRRRSEFAGARGGRRADFGAGIAGEGPQLDTGEK